MTDADVITAIRRHHLMITGEDEAQIQWDMASVDPGGTLWGAGPYLHVPIWRDREVVLERIHAPERLRRRLAREWRRTDYER